MSTAVTSVANSATSVQLLGTRPSRLMAAIYNDSPVTLYVLLNPGTASTSNYSVQIATNVLYELPVQQALEVYGGPIMGIWASASTGAARITEDYG